MKNLTGLAMALLCMSCAANFQSIVPHLREASAAPIKCPANKIQVAERQVHGDARPVLHWYAEGCGRQYACSGNQQHTECTEMPESEARTMEALVVDRLALETGCATAEVRVSSRSAWVNGQERAYRLEACGKSYVCSVTPGRTTACKAAL